MKILELAEQEAKRYNLDKALLALTNEEQSIVKATLELMEKYRAADKLESGDAVKLAAFYGFLSAAAGTYLSRATKAEAKRRMDKALFILRLKSQRGKDSGIVGTEKDFEAAGIIATAPLLRLEASSEALGKYLIRLADGAYELSKVIDNQLRQIGKERFSCT